MPFIETPLMATANGRFEGVLVRGMRVEDIHDNKTITGNVLSNDVIRRAFSTPAVEARLRPVIGIEQFGASPVG